MNLEREKDINNLLNAAGYVCMYDWKNTARGCP
jgi:hypothetical protein